MATPIPIPNYNFTTLDEYIRSLENYIGYLEKANGSDLGDFTQSGKTRNAGFNNYTIYWDWYHKLGYGNLQGQPYCACFVSVSLVAAFGLEKAKELLCGNLFVYCPTGYNRFSKKGRIHSTPKKGDLALFWSRSLNRFGHVGVVIDVDANNKGFTTIEANTSSGNNTVVRNGGATIRKHYHLNGSNRIEFARPDYEAFGISLNPKPLEIEKYPISVGSHGLTCLCASVLNVRRNPGTNHEVLFQINKHDRVYPTFKSFVNGAPWLYITVNGRSGWCSGACFEGWVFEQNDGRWWYMENGYKYPVNAIRHIGDYDYFFDSNGYLFIGELIIKTDATGAIKYDQTSELKNESSIHEDEA